MIGVRNEYHTVTNQIKRPGCQRKFGQDKAYPQSTVISKRHETDKQVMLSPVHPHVRGDIGGYQGTVTPSAGIRTRSAKTPTQRSVSLIAGNWKPLQTGSKNSDVFLNTKPSPTQISTQTSVSLIDSLRASSFPSGPLNFSASL